MYKATDSVEFWGLEKDSVIVHPTLSAEVDITQPMGFFSGQNYQNLQIAVASRTIGIC